MTLVNTLIAEAGLIGYTLNYVGQAKN